MPRRMQRGKGGKGAQALRKVNKLERQVGKPEYKHVRPAISLPLDADTGNVVSLCAIGQGSTASTREGVKIRLKSIEFGGECVIHASATHTSVRVMIVRDNSRDATIPGVTSIFDSLADMIGFEPRTESLFRNRKYTVLWDKKFYLGTAGDGNIGEVLHFYKSLNHLVTFSGPNSTDEGPGMLYLIGISDEGTNTPVLSGSVVIRFTDM